MSDTTQDDMNAAELTTPLKPAARARAKARAQAAGAGKLLRAVPYARIALALSGAFLGSILAYLALVHDPAGGEPQAVSIIVPGAVPDPDDTPAAPATANPGGPASAATLEQQAGVTVFRPGGGSAPGSVVISVADPAATGLRPAPDPRLVERTRFGVLPKIGADGLRPMDAYARPVVPFPSGATPSGRIAIVVGGLGISQSATGDALARLPRAATLAFAPYGTDLERNVAAARAAGHEVMLQAPMEPFDYPDNDPGPHTLLVANPAENRERLSWLLGRFPGYVGIINFMGAKLTADDGAISPVLKAIGERGLFFLDDGSSPRSVAVAAAGRVKAPAVRADAVIDAVPNPAAIDAALARLEERAKDKGLAIGVASALPLTVERIARWSASLEQKGILLVPVSSAARDKTP